MSFDIETIRVLKSYLANVRIKKFSTFKASFRREFVGF